MGIEFDMFDAFFLKKKILLFVFIYLFKLGIYELWVMNYGF